MNRLKKLSIALLSIFILSCNVQSAIHIAGVDSKTSTTEVKVVDGKALESTPLNIAKANLKKSLVGDFIVAKVKYTSRVVDISKNLVDADEDLENPQHSDDNNDGFELWDMERGLEGDCFIEYLTFDDTCAYNFPSGLIKG